MRRIEITEELLRDGATVLHQGDIVTRDDHTAAEWIRLGWARDPETGEQGEREPGAHKIQPRGVSQAQK